MRERNFLYLERLRRAPQRCATSDVGAANGDSHEPLIRGWAPPAEAAPTEEFCATSRWGFYDTLQSRSHTGGAFPRLVDWAKQRDRKVLVLFPLHLDALPDLNFVQWIFDTHHVRQ